MRRRSPLRLEVAASASAKVVLPDPSTPSIRANVAVARGDERGDRGEDVDEHPSILVGSSRPGRMADARP
jgi:hypothetical protein